jgi:hypothetical protein
MGLLKGTLTFSRYRLAGPLPPRFKEFFDRQIRAFSFREVPGGGAEKSLGWTGLENPLDTQFAYANYAIGDYLAFSLRIDRKQVPPSLLKLKLLEAEKKASGEKGGKFVSKEGQDEMRERVRLDLLQKAQPVPSFFDVGWSVAQNWLFFGSLSTKVLGEFEDLFKRTFNIGLHPFFPWDPRYLEGKTAEKIAALKGSSLLASPAQPNDGKPMNPSLLGRDFLTWLWFASEERGGAVRIQGGGDVEIQFVRRMALESGEGEYASSVICQGLHADLKEGKIAIREGKRIKEARLQIRADTDQWEFTLKADPFQIQSLKLPAGFSLSEEEEEKEGRILERIHLTEKALQILDQLFSFFLVRRLSSAWSAEEIPRLKKWVQRSD